MKNLKFYLIAAAVITAAALVVTISVQGARLRRMRAENTRLQNNNTNLMQKENSTTILLLREKEVTGRLKRERDSLAKVAGIRPKNIIRLQYTTVQLSLTHPQPVTVKPSGKNTWQINDSTNCFVWRGSALLEGDSLRVNRLLFRYDAKVNSMYYKKRPHKFLGIPWGRFIFTEVSSSDCGSVQVKQINFTR